MAGSALLAGVRDTVDRKVVMALELLDPVTGLAVVEGIRAQIAGLPPPVITPSRRFVWREVGPPQARQVRVRLELANPQYDLPPGPLTFNLPANDGTTAPMDLRKQVTLRTSPLYHPPEGMIAVAGTLKEGNGSRAAVAGAQIAIEISHGGLLGQLASGHAPITDDNGDFIAVLTGLTDERPDPEPGLPGTIGGWLKVRRGAETRDLRIDPPMLPGRTTYLAAPLLWEPDSP